MKTPDHRLFEEDLEDAAYRAGALKGLWGIAEADAVPADLVWPRVCFWLLAAPRNDCSDRYYVMTDLTGYRSVPPTGTFWDPVAKATLPTSRFPKARPGTRFERVFRTDWEGGRAFYHPFDRFALGSHGQWPTEQPHLIWDDQHTIADYLEEFQSLLMSEDYLGR